MQKPNSWHLASIDNDLPRNTVTTGWSEAPEVLKTPVELNQNVAVTAASSTMVSAYLICSYNAMEKQQFVLNQLYSVNRIHDK